MNFLKEIKTKPFPRDDCYPFNIPSVADLQHKGGLRFSSPVTFLVGENGTGKSTIIEAISILLGFNPEGGSKDFSFSTNNTHSELYKYLLPVKSTSPADGFFLRAESFYNTASYLESVYGNEPMPRYGGSSLHEKSHGESFLSLISNRFEGNGIYILDEPEAALSPEKLMTLLVLINNLKNNNSQFIISTHSPVLMAYPGAEILELSNKGINSVSYKETSHYKITKQFIDNPERMMKYLFEE